MSLLDHLQLAVALEHSSACFLTNDVCLKKVSELRVIALDDYV